LIKLSVTQGITQPRGRCQETLLSTFETSKLETKIDTMVIIAITITIQWIDEYEPSTKQITPKNKVIAEIVGMQPMMSGESISSHYNGRNSH
jgi:hypothetical protein